MIGTKLAYYEITAHLGAGGMGEVYQATDTKLGRSVAVKFLPEAFSHDSERVARFEREARVLASLNHPNIAAIHGLEESGGRKFLVMELVAGETLAERIARGAIPLDESLAVAKEIAEALEVAHDKGIVHRDLKPANVKITPEGRVKVLDFGLARHLEIPAAGPDESQSPTVAGLTQAGMILGTPSYMSPEQARGKPMDKRADLWAFGCVPPGAVSRRIPRAGLLPLADVVFALSAFPAAGGFTRAVRAVAAVASHFRRRDRAVPRLVARGRADRLLPRDRKGTKDRSQGT